MARNKTDEKKGPNAKPEKQKTETKEKERSKAPYVDLPNGKKEAKSIKQETRDRRKQQYWDAKGQVRHRNGQVADLKNELYVAQKKINRRDEDIQNAYTQAEKLKRESKDSKKSPEEKRKNIDQAEAFYAKAKEWEMENGQAKEELKTIQSRLDTAKYANIQSRRSWLEAMKGRPSGVLDFLRRVWEKTIFYKIYQGISSTILDGQTKQSQRSMLDQYDEVRKDQRINIEIVRATKDVSHELDKCLNDEEKSEIAKIEELSKLCGKSRATIVAQLDDKEVLQFKFIPSLDNLGKGVIEISKREILQGENGKTYLGKEDLVNSLNYNKHKKEPLLNFSEEKRTNIKLSVYNMLDPDGHTGLLQIPDPDIAKALREELDRNVAEAHAWDPKKERADSEIAAKAAAAKKEEEAIAKKQAEQARAEREKAEKDKVAEPKKYEKLSDFTYGRLDLSAMTEQEKTALQKELTRQIKAADKEFKPSKEQEVLTAKAVFNKLKAKEVVMADNKLFDTKNGKEMMVQFSKEAAPVSLTVAAVKSDEFISKVYESIQAQAEKNKAQINDLLAGEKFPDVKGYEVAMAKTLRAEIMRAGDNREAAAEVNPVIVNTKRELVEKIAKGEVVFAKDLSNTEPAQDSSQEPIQNGKETDEKEATKEEKMAASNKSANSEKQNHILVDKETGGQLVHMNEQGTMQTWTEHDFSEKDFIRSVQREAETLNKAQETAKEVQETVKNEHQEEKESKTAETVKEEKAEKQEPKEIVQGEYTPEKTPQQQEAKEDARSTESVNKIAALVNERAMKEAKIPEIDTCSQKDTGLEESHECPSLADMSREEIPDAEIQDIKNRCYTINSDGYLYDDLSNKICNKDGEAYCISDFEGTKAYDYFQDKYKNTFGHAYSIEETVFDPNQEEVYAQKEEEYIPEEQSMRYEEQQLDYDEYDNQPGCDTVMNAASIHAHAPQYVDPYSIDDNYNGVPDIDER